MGYWEVPCQLCGVSFNIGRYRTRDEPRSASWTTQIGHPNWPMGPTSADGNECGEDCVAVYRGPVDTVRYPKPKLGDGSLWPDDPDEGVNGQDPTFELESDSDSEPLEYDSDEAMTDMGDAGTQGSEDAAEDDEDAPSDDNDAVSEWEFHVHGPPPKPPDQHYDSEFLPLSATWPAEAVHPRDAHHHGMAYEHIAGEHCALTQGGYNGNNIPAEAMQDCRTAQFLVRKSATWTPQADDMDFERDSAYHLTGISADMHSSGSGTTVAPVRHGVRFIETALSDDEMRYIDYDEWLQKAIPFHPACFQIFMVLSRRRLGRVDIDGLANLRNGLYDEYIDGPAFPEGNEDVQEATEQVWQCAPGAEYLVANPVFIPGLRQVLESAVCNDSFDANHSPFADRAVTVASSPSRDPFLSLPIELKVHIVSDLPSKDLAALRLSSRAFTHLPASIWRPLLIREQPWLYEAWAEDASPYRWSYLDAPTLVNDMAAIHACFLNRIHDHENLQHEVDAEALQMWDKHMTDLQEQAIEKLRRHMEEPSAYKKDMLPVPRELPPQRTNWYELYVGVSRLRELPGVRNRQRIMKGVLAILRNIKRGREAAPEKRSDFFDMEGVEWMADVADRMSFTREERGRLYGCVGEYR